MSYSDSPLQAALDWWAGQDAMGGFKTAAAAIFPGWEARRSCRSPHREDRTASFSLYKNGGGAWRFKDHATGEQGGLVGFVMLAGMEEKGAARWLMERGPTADSTLGDSTQGEAEGRGRQTPGRGEENNFQKPPRLGASAVNPAFPPMPVDTIAAWCEGVDYLEANARHATELGQRRGWPAEFARYLVECAAISMPLYNGRRGTAFAVSAPEEASPVSAREGASPGGASENAGSVFPENEPVSRISSTTPIPFHGGGGRGIVMRDIGFHCRLQARCGEKRASWRFVPGELTHGHGIPALPFIIGGPWFPAARLLIIAEGQWDALTFALAAGWLGEGRLWPQDVCVLGIRGASGTRAFLHAYAPFWPPRADCLLLPDGDGAGGRWFQGDDSFAKQLSALCHKVALVNCGAHKDFNDLYRAEKTTPADIAVLLATNGMALESEVAA